MVMVGIFGFKLSITDLKQNMWEINARSFVFLSLQPIAVVFLGVTTH
jgi:hypothetical protein